jgi:hypothetical protein
MRTAYLHVPHEERDEIGTRLDSYLRLAAIVTEQLEALGRGDAARLSQLDTERAVVERELEGTAPPPDESGVAGGWNEQLDRLVNRALEEVKQGGVGDQLLRRHVTRLHEAALGAMRELELRRLGAGPGVEGGKLDVRF